MANEIKTFANIPVSHWIKLRQQFKKSIPGTISSNYLSSVLGMSEASAKVNVLPTLRLINFIDEKGNTNQEYAKRFRDDTQYKEFCQELLESNYPQEVRDAFPDTDVERNKVRSWFMNHSGVGDSAAQRIVAFYFTLLDANTSIETVNSTPKPKTSKAPNSSEKKESKQETKRAIEIEQPSAKEEVKKFDQNMPDLNINIQIHISSDASADQIEKIFEAMSKHLYKK